MANKNKKTEEKVEEKTEETKEETKEVQEVEETQPDSEVKTDDIESEEQKEEAKTSEIQEEKTKEDEEIKGEIPAEEQEEKIETEEKVEEDKTEAEEEVVEEITEPVEEEIPVKTEPEKEEKKPAKKKDEKKGDFKYIVRIANTDIDGGKTVIMGLAQIKGIGRHMAVLMADAAGMDRRTKIGDLNDAQIEKIKEALENLNKTAPEWMLNRRKDLDTGENIHLISSDIDLRLRDDVNLLKMIRSYRGIRHETGLRVRGQRTRANNRKGLALGVSKKRPT